MPFTQYNSIKFMQDSSDFWVTEVHDLLLLKVIPDPASKLHRQPNALRSKFMTLASNYNQISNQYNSRVIIYDGGAFIRFVSGHDLIY